MTAATCAFYACTSDSPDLASPEDYQEMKFVASEVSRSVVSGINYEGSSFAIFGDMKYSGDSPAEIFNNVEVKYDGSTWNYAGTQYWLPRHEYSFVALYPYQSEPVSSEPVYDDIVYNNSKLSFKYSLPLSDDQSADENKKVTEPSKLADILVANHRRMYAEDASKLTAPVSLNFFHILSRIDFRLKNDNFSDALRVTKIELEGVDRTGDFSITPASLPSGAQTQTNDYNCDWTDVSDRGTLTANIDAYVPRNGDVSLFADDEALLMIPQPDNKDVIVNITYTIINDGKDDKEATLTVPTPIGGWKMGYIYTYAIKVERKTISFTVDVADWKDGIEKDIMVPRK